MSIGDNCVFQTWYSVPNGVPSSIYVGDNSVIGSGSIVASCIIDDQVTIGENSIISEGVKIGKGAVIAPNSYIPPGRVIPSGTYWEGSPVVFVREVKEEESYNTLINSYENWVTENENQKSLNDDSLKTEREEKVKDYVSENYFKWRAKYYH